VKYGTYPLGDVLVRRPADYDPHHRPQSVNGLNGKGTGGILYVRMESGMRWEKDTGAGCPGRTVREVRGRSTKKGMGDSEAGVEGSVGCLINKSKFEVKLLKKMEKNNEG